MRIPYWLLRLLPMWSWLCPKCKKEVEKNSHKCIHCKEQYGKPVRIPPHTFKELLKGNSKPAEDYVHKHVFPRISKEQRGYLAQYFTVIFESGWENSGGVDVTDGGAWTGSSGTPTVVASPVHHGSYAMKCDHEGVEYVYKTFGSAYAAFFLRFYYRTDTLPPSGKWHDIVRFYEGASERASLFLYHDGTYLELGIDINGAVEVHDVIAANTWYCMEFEYDNNDDLHHLWLDGGLIVTNTNAALGSVDTVQLGVAGTNAYTGDSFFDCVVVADQRIYCETAYPLIGKPLISPIMVGRPKIR